MPILFDCAHCGHPTHAADEYAGQAGPCAQCGKTIRVPWPQQSGDGTESSAALRRAETRGQVTSRAVSTTVASVAQAFDLTFPMVISLLAVVLAVIGLGAFKVASVTRIGPVPGLCGVIAVAASVVLALAAIGRTILGPLDTAARQGRRPTQFTMADFLALMFLLQLPIALIRLVVPKEVPHGFLYGFAWVASCLMWGLSVRTLSGAGVETPWRRVVFLSAVLPIAYFGSVAFVASVLLGAIALFIEPGGVRGLWWFIAIIAIQPAGFYWAARFVRAMLRHRRWPDFVKQQ